MMKTQKNIKKNKQSKKLSYSQKKLFQYFFKGTGKFYIWITLF